MDYLGGCEKLGLEIQHSMLVIERGRGRRLDKRLPGSEFMYVVLVFIQSVPGFQGARALSISRR
jgi:hypothetical protein